MNWNIEEQTKEGLTVRPLAWSFHKTLALAIVEANLKHAPDVVQETRTSSPRPFIISLYNLF